MTIHSLVFNPFYENTYVISDEDGVAIIVDPGCYESYEKDQLKSYILEQNLEVKVVLNTHCHIDHVLGNAFAKDEFNAELWVPEGEKSMLEAVADYASNWGIGHFEEATVDRFIGTEPIAIGQLKFDVRLAPGHSPGHLVFYNSDEKVLIGGDVLFRESIGRTDLPGGDHQELLRSIQTQLFTLPEDTTVYSGHGPTTHIGYEKVHNPFCKNL